MKFLILLFLQHFFEMLFLFVKTAVSGLSPLEYKLQKDRDSAHFVHDSNL